MKKVYLNKLGVKAFNLRDQLRVKRRSNSQLAHHAEGIPSNRVANRNASYIAKRDLPAGAAPLTPRRELPGTSSLTASYNDDMVRPLPPVEERMASRRKGDLKTIDDLSSSIERRDRLFNLYSASKIREKRFRLSAERGLQSACGSAAVVSEVRQSTQVKLRKGGN